jgi:hypothetical protein
MSDIQYKQKYVANIKIEDNNYSEANYALDWPDNSMKLFNKQYKKWEIRRNLATESTQGNFYKRSHSKLFVKTELPD